MNDINSRGFCDSYGGSASVNKLIGEIATLLANAINKENDAKGVAVGYRAILFCLAQNDGITQLEISKRVGIKPPTTSVALSKMEAEGYVTRRTAKDDLRKILVTLTPKGRDIVNGMLDVFFEFDKIIAKVLTAEELDTLKNLLTIVKKRVSIIKEENFEE